ncbi:hypothetical protein DFJ77DRAFT_224286 [Powellomyces hirtus]|nr:hypothetical protein DFJ77DRAFT_224286 [Powellomyces hirtus]
MSLSVFVILLSRSSVQDSAVTRLLLINQRYFGEQISVDGRWMECLICQSRVPIQSPGPRTRRGARHLLLLSYIQPLSLPPSLFRPRFALL